MDSFENTIRTLVTNLRRYSLLEFYHEESELKTNIKNLSQKLESFDVYLPKTRITVSNLAEAKAKIKVDIRERIKNYIKPIDHSFAIENYNYICDSAKGDLTKEIYRKLGPFDHYMFLSEEDEENEDSRTLRLDFEFRKSGTMFRGQTNSSTCKPDGYGFKVFPNGGVFEG